MFFRASARTASAPTDNAAPAATAAIASLPAFRRFSLETRASCRTSASLPSFTSASSRATATASTTFSLVFLRSCICDLLEERPSRSGPEAELVVDHATYTHAPPTGLEQELGALRRP